MQFISDINKQIKEDLFFFSHFMNPSNGKVEKNHIYEKIIPFILNVGIRECKAELKEYFTGFFRIGLQVRFFLVFSPS